MSGDRLRYTRQIRLPEIGEEGQARLGAATIAPSGQGEARTVEATYLRLAGIGTVRDDEVGALDVDVASLGVRDPAARDVAEGALRALAAIRGALGR